MYKINFTPEKIIFLDNIRSAHNVGSIFRTADGAGVNKIYLGGYTPAPTDRFGREVSEIKKTSLGASCMVPYEVVSEEEAVAKLKELKSSGFNIVAVEQTPNSVSLHDFVVPEKVCYVFGNEINGVRSEILDVVDTVVEIPMQGTKESLNVGVSVGVVVFKL